MRQLASIQRITDIQPIPDADAIEVASVLGWKVVVKKGQFSVGDLAVYLEIDSVPPDEEQYRFLWKNTEMRPNNFRIKTIKLRGQISQGILFPMTIYPGDGITMFVGDEGADLTEALKITKYEPPLPRGSADIEGQFFDGVPKTDEDRVQSRADLVAELQGRPYYITVKCDGASMTVATHDGQPKVASRNYRLADNPDSAYWRAARADGLLDLAAEHPDYAIQGELVGPGIQNNRLGLFSHHCLVFNVYDLTSCSYLSWEEMKELQTVWNFEMVPLVERSVSFTHTQESLLKLAEGKYGGTDNEREGIVVRSDGVLDRVSFKAISNKFLLKGGE